jgi:integrase
MAQTINQLTATKVKNLKAPGYHADGGGLHLQVSQAGRKSWIFTYRFANRAREMGLGSESRVTLAEARDQRDKCNRLLREHIDPIEHRNKQRAAAVLKERGTITFAEATDKYLTAHRAEWTHKHFKQWQQTLTQHAGPELGKLLVSDIAVGHVVRVLEAAAWPAVTAQRLRGRIEGVLDWATVHSYRQGDNPARWRGNLDQLLSKPGKSRKIQHLPALPYSEIPTFMAALRRQEGSAARALEFCVLTAARSNEALRAAAAEVDYANKIWTVPADRMKARKEWRVPLSARAMELAGQGSTPYLFPGQHPEKPAGGKVMQNVLKRMGYGHISTHGMRSSFRDWAAERTNYQNHVIEMALAHTIGSAVEAAYRRGDFFDKRRQLMDAWAKFCATSPAKSADKGADKAAAKVVPLRSAR